MHTPVRVPLMFCSCSCVTFNSSWGFRIHEYPAMSIALSRLYDVTGNPFLIYLYLFIPVPKGLSHKNGTECKLVFIFANSQTNVLKNYKDKRFGETYSSWFSG